MAWLYIMKRTSFRPRVHLYVCCNRRDANNALGPGCGAHGDVFFDALKQQIQQQSLVQTVWVARTSCLGFCPKKGCAVGMAPGPTYWVEVETKDVSEMLKTVLAPISGE